MCEQQTKQFAQALADAANGRSPAVPPSSTNFQTPQCSPRKRISLEIMKVGNGYVLLDAERNGDTNVDDMMVAIGPYEASDLARAYIRRVLA